MAVGHLTLASSRQVLLTSAEGGLAPLPGYGDGLLAALAQNGHTKPCPIAMASDGAYGARPEALSLRPALARGHDVYST